jgi:ankyrin repeat protein
MSAVHNAAERRDLANVAELLKDNPGLVSWLDSGGRTALHWAASMGHLDMTKLLIDNGSDVNVQGSGGNRAGAPYGTPMHFAARKGRADIVRLLLANMGQVDSRNKKGRTLLHDASECCHAGVARILIANNADVNAKDNDGGTPFHCGATSGCADRIIQARASFYARSMAV